MLEWMQWICGYICPVLFWSTHGSVNLVGNLAFICQFHFESLGSWFMELIYFNLFTIVIYLLHLLKTKLQIYNWVIVLVDVKRVKMHCLPLWMKRNDFFWHKISVGLLLCIHWILSVSKLDINHLSVCNLILLTLLRFSVTRP